MKKPFAISFLRSFRSTILFCQVPLDDIQSMIERCLRVKGIKSIIVGKVDANGKLVFTSGL